MENTERLNDALNCINAGEYAKAIELLQPFLKEGNATAQYLMGYMYSNGYGVSKDAKKAEELYLASGQQGLGVSYYHLGALYYKELNQMEKAYQSFVKGARLHDRSCIHNGKFMLENKLGVTATKEEEVRWQLYEAYFDNGTPRFMTDLYYAEGKFSPEFGEELVDLYYYKAKRENDLSAMFTLACAYLHGKGTAQNTKKAVYWLKKLVEQDQNHVLGWISLYESGEISKDELLEQAKKSNSLSFLKEVKKELGITEEVKQMTIEEELKLIRTLYQNLSSFPYLQVREYCCRHHHLSDLNRLKEEMLSILKTPKRSHHSLIAKDLYWVVDEMERLGAVGCKGEKAALETMYGIHLRDRKWIETEEIEAEYLYSADGKAEFMHGSTFEIISISCDRIESYASYLEEGMRVKLHYLPFGSFEGITI